MARQAQKKQQEPDAPEVQRLDKWLWFARVAKTRTLAAGLVADGRVRVNRVRTTKPAQSVHVDDVITVSVARGVRVLKIVAVGVRRGPASQAALLYEEIVPLQQAPRSDGADRGQAGDVPAQLLNGAGQGGPVSEAGSGRPTKRDRRILDRLRSRSDE